MTVSPRWSDEQVDRLIGLILQTGVVLSGLLVLIGGVLYLLRYGTMPANYRQFGVEPSEIHGVQPIVAGALRGNGRSIIELGIVVLVATPVIRVLFSVFAFAARRDWLYVPITLLVLGILLYGLLGGAH
jgi:uncharacterized membrane protein